MGDVYFDKKDFVKAEELYKKSFNLIENEKIFDDDKYYKVTLSLSQLSLLYLETDRANEVTKRCLEVLDYNLNTIKSEETRNNLISECINRYIDYSVDYLNREDLQSDEFKLISAINKVSDEELKNKLSNNLKKIYKNLK